MFFRQNDTSFSFFITISTEFVYCVLVVFFIFRMRQKYVFWLYSEINIQFKRTVTIPNTLPTKCSHCYYWLCPKNTKNYVYIHTKNVDWYEEKRGKKHLTNKTVNIHHRWLECYFFYSRTYKTISLADGLSISKKRHFFLF